ncbi:MAG: hypothetical protein JSS22_04425 [Proteobacteria bacterium]|nr:hypothetical protein [Pseudomonadota bacterium]
MLRIVPKIPQSSKSGQPTTLVALVTALAQMKVAFREVSQRHEALSAEYEVTLPPVPDVLLYTKRDWQLFGVSLRIGASLPDHVDRFRSFLKHPSGTYRVSGGKLSFHERRDVKARAAEIIQACEAWRRAQDEHSRAIGLMGVCNDLDEVLLSQADLSQRISRIRVQSLDGLKLKAVAARACDHKWQADLINESIVRDLNTLTKSPSPRAPASSRPKARVA